MQVVIPLAGKSERFRAEGFAVPKWLLPVGEETMLEAVLNGFDDSDTFFLIYAEGQVGEEVEDWLRGLRPNTVLVKVEQHSLGPTFSAVRAPIDDELPVIVSYCDFLVSWEYQRFKRVLYGTDGALSTFTGFHPASFGETMYAYCRSNKNKELLEIREKASFTQNRVAEQASTGLYGFRSGSSFRHYASMALEGMGGQAEVYVTAVVDLMLRDGASFSLQEVEKFICLGTPDDYRQYLHWSEAANRYFDSPRQPPISTSLNSIVTMAGRGSRFRAEEIRTPKPLIPLSTGPIFLDAAACLPFSDRTIFITTRDMANRYPLKDTIATRFPSSRLVALEEPTDGQIETAHRGIGLIEDETPVMVSAADCLVFFDKEALNNRLMEDWDVIVFSAKQAKGTVRDYGAFAYCVTLDGGLVTKVVEKRTISSEPWHDHLVTGAFFFRSASVFEHVYRLVVQEDARVNGELHIANGLNLAIEAGVTVKVFEVLSWISLGDPFELQTFYYWTEYFSKNRHANHG